MSDTPNINKLLIDDQPILVLPKLAEAVGLNEAIVLQQMHYWLRTSKHDHNGFKWVYNTYPEWQQQFPFWSVDTVKRTILRLQDGGFLVEGNFNKSNIDRTKWYRIDYDKLAGLIADPRIGQSAPIGDEEGKVHSPLVQDAPSNDANCPNAIGQSAPTNTRDYPETTTENTHNNFPSENGVTASDGLGDILSLSSFDEKPISQPSVKTYGDPDINKVIKAFTAQIGHMTKIAFQRREANILIRQYGLDRVLGAINTVAEYRGVKFFPGVRNVADLREEWVALENFALRESSTSRSKMGVL